jgi:hypothetical protein
MNKRVEIERLVQETTENIMALKSILNQLRVNIDTDDSDWANHACRTLSYQLQQALKAISGLEGGVADFEYYKETPVPRPRRDLF